MRVWKTATRNRCSCISTTATSTRLDAVEGSVRESLGDFQLKQRDQMIETLPEDVFELGKQLPVQIRKRFVSMMEMWSVDRK